MGVKHELLIRQKRGVLYGNYPERPKECLIDDGIKAVNWKIKEIKLPTTE